MVRGSMEVWQWWTKSIKLRQDICFYTTPLLGFDFTYLDCKGTPLSTQPATDYYTVFVLNKFSLKIREVFLFSKTTCHHAVEAGKFFCEDFLLSF